MQRSNKKKMRIAMKSRSRSRKYGQSKTRHKIGKSRKVSMKISCVTCNKAFESVIIDKVMAWNECYNLLMQHAMKRHPEVMAQLQVDIQKLMVSVSGYVSVSRLADVPEEEKYINLLLDEFQRDIMVAAGFDEVEEDEEEDDDEGEEDGEENGGDEIEVEEVEESEPTPLEIELEEPSSSESDVGTAVKG